MITRAIYITNDNNDNFVSRRSIRHRVDRDAERCDHDTTIIQAELQANIDPIATNVESNTIDRASLLRLLMILQRQHRQTDRRRNFNEVASPRHEAPDQPRAFLTMVGCDDVDVNYLQIRNSIRDPPRWIRAVAVLVVSDVPRGYP